MTQVLTILFNVIFLAGIEQPTLHIVCKDSYTTLIYQVHYTLLSQWVQH